MRLERLQRMKLFPPLKNGLSIEVNFVNPALRHQAW
jgi:hypothetical protein